MLCVCSAAGQMCAAAVPACCRARAPELEAKKKAAAAARDFKAAAEAAAEAKVAAADVDASRQLAVSLQQQVAALQGEEQQVAERAQQAEAAVAAAVAAATKARWRGLLGTHAELHKQLVVLQGGGGCDSLGTDDGSGKNGLGWSSEICCILPSPRASHPVTPTCCLQARFRLRWTALLPRLPALPPLTACSPPRTPPTWQLPTCLKQPRFQQWLRQQSRPRCGTWRTNWLLSQQRAAARRIPGWKCFWLGWISTQQNSKLASTLSYLPVLKLNYPYTWRSSCRQHAPQLGWGARARSGGGIRSSYLLLGVLNSGQAVAPALPAAVVARKEGPGGALHRLLRPQARHLLLVQASHEARRVDVQVLQCCC